MSLLLPSAPSIEREGEEGKFKVVDVNGRVED